MPVVQAPGGLPGAAGPARHRGGLGPEPDLHHPDQRVQPHHPHGKMTLLMCREARHHGCRVGTDVTAAVARVTVV